MSAALAIIQQPPKPLIQIVDSPITMTLQPELAVEIGLNESIVLRQIAFWIKTSNNCRDGQWWTYQSLSEMREKAFKFWSVTTISRIINKLVELGLIEKTDRYNPRRNDRTQWFALNIEKLQELTSIKVILQDEKPNVTKSVTVLQDDKTIFQSATGIFQSETTLPETTTEITTEKKNRKKEQRPRDPGGPDKKPEPILQEQDTPIGRCCRLWEKNHSPLVPRIKDNIIEAVVEFGEISVLDAMNEAVEQNIRGKWSYVAGILRNWKKEGRQSKAKASQGTDWAAQAEQHNSSSAVMSDKALIAMWYRGLDRFMSDEDKTRLEALLAEIDAARAAGQPESPISEIAS